MSALIMSISQGKDHLGEKSTPNLLLPILHCSLDISLPRSLDRYTYLHIQWPTQIIIVQKSPRATAGDTKNLALPTALPMRQYAKRTNLSTCSGRCVSAVIALRTRVVKIANMLSQWPTLTKTTKSTTTTTTKTATTVVRRLQLRTSVLARPDMAGSAENSERHGDEAVARYG